MKKILIVASTVAFSFLAQAQSSKNTTFVEGLRTSKLVVPVKKDKSQTFQQRLLTYKKVIGASTMPSSTAERPNAIKKRLIGKSYYDNFELYDTMSFSYSGTRTSKFDNCYQNLLPEENLFNPIMAFELAPDPMAAYDSLFPLRIEADTIMQLGADGPGTFYPYLAHIMKYDSVSGKLKEFNSGESIDELYEKVDSFQYNANGKVMRFNYYEEGQFVGYVYKTYNSAGKKLSDSIAILEGGVFYPGAAVSYQYNNQGHLTEIGISVEMPPFGPIPGGWMQIMKSTMTNTNAGYPDTIRYFELDFNTMTMMPAQGGRENYRTYDGNGRMITNVEFYNDINMVEYSMKDSFSYAGTNQLFSTNIISEWNTTSNSWEPYFSLSAHLNASNNWDTVYEAYTDVSPNVWEPYAKIVLNYNSDDLVTDFNYHYWEGTDYAVTPEEQMFFYYEDYDDGISSVGNRNKFNSTFTIYPNPSSGTITVGGLNQKVNLTLYNVDGRKMLNASNTTTLNLASLPAGSYWLRVTNDKNEVIGTQQVIKP